MIPGIFSSEYYDKLNIGNREYIISLDKL